MINENDYTISSNIEMKALGLLKVNNSRKDFFYKTKSYISRLAAAVMVPNQAISGSTSISANRVKTTWYDRIVGVTVYAT